MWSPGANFIVQIEFLIDEVDVGRVAVQNGLTVSHRRDKHVGCRTSYIRDDLEPQVVPGGARLTDVNQTLLGLRSS